MSASDELLSAYLQNQALERAEEYARQGRRFAAENTEVLKARWIKDFQEWVKSAQAGKQQDKPERQMREDVESELLIRNVQPPFEAVQKEKTALLEATKLVIERLRREPSR